VTNQPNNKLTPWIRIFTEKLTGPQLVNKFPALHGTRRFITAFTIVRHPVHAPSWKSILILSFHLHMVHSTLIQNPNLTQVAEKRCACKIS